MSPILRLFSQLGELLEQLSDEQYCQPIALLSGATVGQHIRHIIECFQELEEGYSIDRVNYDLRKRDRRLETDRDLVFLQMTFVESALAKPDKSLKLHAAFDEGVEVTLSSTYYRELMHNLDHAIHHMAMIRVGLTAMPGIALPEDFGVAYSTLKFRANNHSINRN
ncbi:MAG TPA: hypothetical protein VHC50_00460 [Puia sp.]|jgi:hypothetical protein|nr:hypothetical protein [Puia sp.]